MQRKDLPKNEKCFDEWWHEQYNKLYWYYTCCYSSFTPEKREELQELIAIVAKADEPYLAKRKSRSVDPLMRITFRVHLAISELSWNQVGHFMLAGMIALGNHFAAITPSAPH